MNYIYLDRLNGVITSLVTPSDRGIVLDATLNLMYYDLYENIRLRDLRWEKSYKGIY